MRGSAIWAALDRARAMNLAANGEAPAARGDGGITRRRVIAAAIAATAASAMPDWAHAARPPRRIAIIGGGLAGLSALWRLRGRKVDATCYEARLAAGGRTRGVTGVFAPGYAFDEGGQLVNSDHRDMIRLARTLGLKLINREAVGLPRDLHIGRAGTIVPEAALAEALRRIAAQITADADRLDADYDTVAPEIDAMSVAQYLDRYGLPAGDARDTIEAGLRTEYGAEPEDASALELLFNLPTVDGARLTRLPLSDERFVIDGGAGQVAGELFRRLTPHVKLGKRLASLRIEGAGVRLSFADGETTLADRVILAVPAPLLREIAIEGPLPEIWRALIAEIDLGRNEKLLTGYPATPWIPALGFAGNLWAEAPGFSAAWDARSGVPAGGPGAFGYFLGGAQVAAANGQPTAALAAQFDAAARAAIPALPAPSGLYRRTNWTQDPLSRGAYVNFRPGQLTRFGSLLTLEEEGEKPVASRAGPILFAGEWCSDAWPGYMEGAAQTGRIAAEAALA